MKKQAANIHSYTREFMRGNQIPVVFGVLQILMNTAGSLMLAWLIQQAVDLMSAEGTAMTLGRLCVFALLTLLVCAAAYGCDYLSRPRFTARAMAQYKNHVFQKLTQKGMAAFSKEGSSLYISALSNDAAAIETNYLGSLFGLAGAVVLFVMALVMMLCYSPLLTAFSIMISFLPILMALLTSKKAAEAERKVSDVNEQYISSLQDSLLGFSVIKAFRAENKMSKIFCKKVEEVHSAKEKHQKIMIVIEMLSSLSGAMVQLGVFLMGAYLAVSGRGITAGTVVVFVQLLNYILQPISVIPGYLAGIRSSKSLIEKLAQKLEENVQETGTLQKTELKKGIAVQGVSFAYEKEKPILKNIHCVFEKGKSYAIVGASGSGKSTLLHMLTAAYPDYTGSICYDDAEMRSIRSDALYDLLSVIQQNVFIFNASIRENITMFSEFADEEVQRAIRLSGLSGLIAEKGEGYRCGENGANLSGGEKQRISIARSLLRKPQVLLADEVTAALDGKTSYQVSDAILNLSDITRIVVTHDLEGTLLRRYDGILAIKSGEIVESGTFEELMERKGYFYSLYTVAQ